MQRGAVLDVDRDVLAEPVGTGADQPHVGRHAVELMGEDGGQPLVLARLDDERQLRQLRPERLISHVREPRTRTTCSIACERHGLTGWLRFSRGCGLHEELNQVMSAELRQAEAGVLGWIDRDITGPIRDFQNPDQEWRRLFSELYGTFLLVI